jgi:alpha-glucosidase
MVVPSGQGRDLEDPADTSSAPRGHDRERAVPPLDSNGMTSSQDGAAGPPWWKTGILYQVYPRSYSDADGDGIGDLNGIISRLDYVAGLGVDAIWLSPIFRSPMADFGYDIAEYCEIDALFGSNADADRLVAEAHRRRLRVIFDLVPNHTSDEHLWFVDARSGRHARHRDWYLWRDPGPDGGPPNNWQSYFGGSAWEWDETSEQFYLHLFHPKQPDLNWRNRAVRAAMYDVMRFWFERGIDGFRIDVLWLLIKDDEFPDNPPPPPLQPGEYEWSRYDKPAYEDRPEVLDVVREMRAVADEYDDRVLIGEIYLPLERLTRYYGDRLDGVHLPFNFALAITERWEAPALRDMIVAYERALPAGAWPNWVLGNHDVARIATRIGPPRLRLAQMLLLTLRGTPTCYYGDELGMLDTPINAERILDPQASVGKGRDPARTPMQWDSGPNGAFTRAGVTPWLPLAPDYAERNVTTQSSDPHSVLSLFRRVTQLRRQLPALTIGGYHEIQATDDVVWYVREHECQRVLTVLNTSGRNSRLDLSRHGDHGQVLCSTAMDRSGAIATTEIVVRPHEGLIVQLTA